MSDGERSPGPQRPHLLVLVLGLDPTAMAQEPALADLAGPHRAAILPVPADPVAELAATLPAAVLRELGLPVERRSVCLLPPWRSDEQSVAALGRRAGGPAALSVLALRGPLLAAAAHGCGSIEHRRSLATLAADLRQATTALRQRGDARVWLLALGRPVPVAHTLDVRAIARRLVGWPYSSHLSVRADDAIATVRSSSHRAIELLSDRLADSALAGATAVRTTLGLELHAPPCTAFGARPVFARRPHGNEATAMAVLPQPLRTATSLDLPGLVARVVMAVAAGAHEHAGTRPPAPSAPSPSLLPIAVPEPRDLPLVAADPLLPADPIVSDGPSR